MLKIKASVSKLYVPTIYKNLCIMDKNLALFTQINSLSYWLLIESNFKSSIVFRC